jgi:hypothetical protein
MTNTISSAALAALGLALVAGPPAAQAQTVITRDISGQPVETVITQQPVQTVQTTETVRTIRPNGRSSERRVVTTRRTVVRQDVAQQPLYAPQPLYDVVAPPAPVVAARPYGRPLYDTVMAPVPTLDETAVNAAVAPVAPAPAIPVYRYVYEPDRILVIDPVTNIAVQSIPR